MSPDALPDVLRETLSTFSGAPRTTAEVAADLDVSRRSTYDRLDRLVGTGHLETKKVGARGRIWWRPRPLEAGRDELASELAEVFERVEDGFYALDEEWRFTYVNERAAEMLGRSPWDLLGRPIWEEYPRSPDSDLRAHFETVMAEQEPTSVEYFSTTAEAWFKIHVYPSESGLSVYFTDVTERKERQRELERQRERLAAHSNLDHVLREITAGVLDSSSREAIERAVVEAFAEAEAYEFAWFAQVDPATRSIRNRVEAGVEGYVADVDISVDADEAEGRGPAGRAVRTGEVSAVRDVFADPDFEPWRAVAREYGYRGAVAVPVLHEGTLYGVLGVYTRREDAFGTHERRMLARVGEVVGHAIAAQERKLALMGDEVVELEFRVADVLAALGVDAPTDGRISLDHAVPASDGDYLVYGTTGPDDLDLARVLVETLPHWAELTVLDEGDPTRIQARLTEPPVLSAVAEKGGSVESAVIEDGDYRMTVHLAPSVEVREVIAVVRDVYPTAEMVSRRQVSRADETPERLNRVLEEELTDRQHAALEAAFHAGLFEWPRDSSGEEVAAALGISGPTFNQHLRTAQRKVLRSVLADD